MPAARHLFRATTLALVALACWSAGAGADYTPTPPNPAQLRADDVAVVDTTHIPRTEFDDAMRVFRLSAGGVDGHWNSRAKRKATTQIMTALIDRRWYQLEAQRLGVTVSDQAVLDKLNELKRKTFPRPGDYRRFLKQTGQTESDLSDLVRAQLVQEQVQQRWQGSVSVTDDEIAAEYNANPGRYDLPAARDLRMIFTRASARAKLARRALDAGMSFKAAARRFSQDASSRHRGGEIDGVVEGQFERKLDRAIFAARRGAIVGPIKTRAGYYVFEITKITPARKRTLDEARDDIRAALEATKQQANLVSALQTFNATWKPVTLCHAGFEAPECGAYAG